MRWALLAALVALAGCGGGTEATEADLLPGWYTFHIDSVTLTEATGPEGVAVSILLDGTEAARTTVRGGGPSITFNEELPVLLERGQMISFVLVDRDDRMLAHLEWWDEPISERLIYGMQQNGQAQTDAHPPYVRFHAAHPEGGHGH